MTVKFGDSNRSTKTTIGHGAKRTEPPYLCVKGVIVMAHTCHAAGCDKPVPEKMFMCRRHWLLLPKTLRDGIWEHYRPGQEKDKRITKEYSEAAQHCIYVLAKKEGRSPEEVRKACLVYKMCQEPELQGTN